VRLKRPREQTLSMLEDITIPPTIFKHTSLSVMESIVDYLKTSQGLNFHEIGILLDRDERNVWTVYQRAQKKMGLNN